MNDIHPGDAVLTSILGRFPALYGASRTKADEILSAYLKPKIKALQPRKDETPRRYHARLQLAFSGPKWMLARHKIALAFTNANLDATDLVNGGLPRAYEAGFNESAYSLALTGVEAWPITAAIVLSLAAQGVIALKRRKLKRRKDVAYNEQRTQSAVSSAIVENVAVEDMAAKVAAQIASARLNEITAYARAAIYGASDSGAYMAGIEAEKAGLDVEKTWLAIMDMRVRPSHAHLHGTTIPLHEKFHGYSGVLRFPHDPEAPPQETYRCRCRMAVHLAGKSPGEYSRRLFPTQTSGYRNWRDRQIVKAGGELELERLHLRLMG